MSSCSRHMVCHTWQCQTHLSTRWRVVPLAEQVCPEGIASLPGEAGRVQVPKVAAPGRCLAPPLLAPVRHFLHSWPRFCMLHAAAGSPCCCMPSTAASCLWLGSKGPGRRLSLATRSCFRLRVPCSSRLLNLPGASATSVCWSLPFLSLLLLRLPLSLRHRPCSLGLS